MKTAESNGFILAVKMFHIFGPNRLRPQDYPGLFWDYPQESECVMSLSQPKRLEVNLALAALTLKGALLRSPPPLSLLYQSSVLSSFPDISVPKSAQIQNNPD